MENKIKLIKIREQEYQKLKEHKVHPKQPFWEVIRDLINTMEETEDANGTRPSS